MNWHGQTFAGALCTGKLEAIFFVSDLLVLVVELGPKYWLERLFGGKFNVFERPLCPCKRNVSEIDGKRFAVLCMDGTEFEQVFAAVTLETSGVKLKHRPE